MKFTYDYTVRWHDTDAHRRVRPSQVLMYLQETANIQMRAYGMSLDALRDVRGLAFILSRITVRMYAPLCAYDKITVHTWVDEPKGLSFPRYFRMTRGDETVAEGASIWALVRLSDGTLVKGSEEHFEFPIDEPLPRDFIRRHRFPRIEEMEPVGKRRVVYSDIDYNGHMNNTRYPDMLCDFLPEAFTDRIGEMTLSFLHEGTLGHELTVLRHEDEAGHFFFRTLDTDGRVCLEAVLTPTGRI